MNLDALASYTSGRPDILACVPTTALTVLDVGCSNGELGAALRSQVPNRHVTGIEFNQAFCVEAATRLDSVIQGDLNNFEWHQHFDPESFECLIFADVLEHLIDPWSVLRSAVELLARDGVVVVSVPNIRHVSALHSIYIRGTFPKISRGIFDRTHLRWFTLTDSIELCKQAGLRVEKVQPRLRFRDRPGGRLNAFVEKHLDPIASFYPVREFLSYQFILIAVKT